LAVALLAAVFSCVAGCGEAVKDATAPPDVPVQVEPLETRILELGGGVTLELIRVPAGAVLVGSPEPGADQSLRRGPDMTVTERPRHRVRFEKGFWIGRTEVTQAQYEKLMGGNPSRWRDETGKLPVEWRADAMAGQLKDVTAFLAKLSQVTSAAVRLPTEAEWEYACRAPQKAQREAAEPPPLPAYCFGDDPLLLRAFGWADYSGARTHAVGELKPNRWGLHDVHGNVAELCSDPFDPYPDGAESRPHYGKGYPVVRGGSWTSQRTQCRSAARDCFLPELLAGGTVGLRVVVPAD
jgi:formylglycine-generating enzyme required for sulfatase activity